MDEEKYIQPAADCFIKNTKKARMHFIRMCQPLLKHKGKDYAKKYEALWHLHDSDYFKFVTTTYHNVTEDEFRDFVILMKMSHYNF